LKFLLCAKINYTRVAPGSKAGARISIVFMRSGIRRDAMESMVY